MSPHMSSQNFLIALDLDETLAATFHAVFEYGKAKYNWNVSHEDITIHDWWTLPELGITQEQWYALFDEYFERDLGDHSIGIIDGAREGVRTLIEMWAIPHIVTARNEQVRSKATQNWTMRNIPEIVHGEHIHYTNHYEGPKKPNKWEVCRNIGATILVDDNPEFLIHAVEAGITGILLEKPWNKNFPETAGVIRVAHWSEIPNIVARHI